MRCFIVEPPLEIRFEMDLEADAVVWHNDINPIDVREKKS
jgi:hypothetical protein